MTTATPQPPLQPAPQPPTRYIICKPRGGMIDMMTLIVMALKYAKRTNRLLVIDTRKSLHFIDGFRRYFYFSNNKTYKDDLNKLYFELKDKQSYPPLELKDKQIYPPLELKDKKSYPPPPPLDYFNFNPFQVEKEKHPQIDLKRDYQYPVILFGYDNTSLERDINYFFRHFKPKPLITDVLDIRLKKLPSNFISVHVRNTDYKSDVDKFIDDNYDNFKDKPIFLATDDIKSIEKFKKIFSNENIYNFMNLKDKNRDNLPIHKMKRSLKDHERFNIDTVTDFLLLKMGKEIYYSSQHTGWMGGGKNCTSPNVETLVFDQIPL